MATSDKPDELTLWRDDIDDQWTSEHVLELMKTILEQNAAITNLMTNVEQQQGLTVSLIGPPGHGKSSTINGILAALENEYAEKAVVKDIERHATREFRRHRPRLPEISDGKVVVTEDLEEKMFNLSFADFVGIGKDEDMGEALLTALHGFLKEGHKADRKDEEALKSFKDKTEQDQVVETTAESCHVIWVVDIQSGPEALECMNKVTDEATRQGIPQALILTKCDVIEPNVQNDPTHIYRSSDLRQKVSEAAALVGVPLYRTFPIKNYTKEMKVKPYLSYQYLYILQFIMMDIKARLRDLARKDPKRLETLKTEIEERKTAKKK